MAELRASLVSKTINRHTGEIIKREIKEVKRVDEDEFYRPLVEVLGDAFLKQYNKNKEVI